MKCLLVVRLAIAWPPVWVCSRKANARGAASRSPERGSGVWGRGVHAEHSLRISASHRSRSWVQLCYCESWRAVWSRVIMGDRHEVKGYYWSSAWGRGLLLEWGRENGKLSRLMRVIMWSIMGGTMRGVRGHAC